MLVNDYGIRKIKLKITMVLLGHKPLIDYIGMWGSGNIVTCKLEGQWFLPQAGAIFFKDQEITRRSPNRICVKPLQDIWK